MKRTLLAVSVAAAFLVAGCGSSDSTPEAAATMTMPSSTVAETGSATAVPEVAATVSTSPAPAGNATAAAPASALQSYEQMCTSLIESAESMGQLLGNSGDPGARAEIIDSLLTESKASGEWQTYTPAEQAQMLRAFDAAKRGKC
ncbi:hypothetical protein [Prescottella equi]